MLGLHPIARCIARRLGTRERDRIGHARKVGFEAKAGFVATSTVQATRPRYTRRRLRRRSRSVSDRSCCRFPVRRNISRSDKPRGSVCSRMLVGFVARSIVHARPSSQVLGRPTLTTRDGSAGRRIADFVAIAEHGVRCIWRCSRSICMLWSSRRSVVGARVCVGADDGGSRHAAGRRIGAGYGGLQVSTPLQNEPSWHAESSDTRSQLNVTSLHLSLVHERPSSGQTTAVPGAHLPFTHVSTPSQYAPLLHSAEFAQGAPPSVAPEPPSVPALPVVPSLPTEPSGLTPPVPPVALKPPVPLLPPGLEARRSHRHRAGRPRRLRPAVLPPEIVEPSPSSLHEAVTMTTTTKSPRL